MAKYREIIIEQTEGENNRLTWRRVRHGIFQSFEEVAGYLAMDMSPAAEVRKITFYKENDWWHVEIIYK